MQRMKREHNAKDIYSVKHGEKTLVFKKKGEGETPETKKEESVYQKKEKE